MSKTRSPSHTPPSNNSPTNPPPSEPSASRQEIHETSTTGERAPESSFPSPFAPHTIASSSRIRPLEEDESTPTPAMTKRMRRESPPPQEGRSDRSSPSSDSQGGLADTEEAAQSQTDDKSKAPPAVPKKKRTRTLTTPHQSAVLHALLAQSRFPTTAMREEVGRAIGLSARKVQIWFQNQRQKARRPRTQNEAPLSRPPQYGPFPSVQDTDTVNLYPRPQPTGRSDMIVTAYTEQERDDPRRYEPSHPLHTHTMPPSRLLGPGMPGYGSQIESRMSPELSPVAGPSHSFRHQPYRHSLSPPRLHPLQLPNPPTTYTTRPRDPSRTLPPLIFPSPARHPTSSSIRSAPATLPPPFPFQHRSLSPEILSNVGSSAAIPPPFTLQPRPQWDDPVFTTVPRTGSSTWSQPSPLRGDSVSPTTSRTIGPIPEEPPSTSDSPSTTRSGRYDPVRGSVVPYQSPPPPSPRPADS
ncbi:zinc finger protein (homeobox domain) [Moniliophthora roreri MCA 2997]|uniref:Zinc finger protein (Homeobox domain) n=2 Tax=Moniliophthora roreri TaxID=221103 RepID=V2X149_MONRO|nr:zinc finger protein (homeobox domain) [Moniliophthora roreri MCA 2997]KAI3615074.1 zinc finger protein (homeobox domain) [Moniliophthora roreri]